MKITGKLLVKAWVLELPGRPPPFPGLELGAPTQRGRM